MRITIPVSHRRQNYHLTLDLWELPTFEQAQDVIAFVMATADEQQHGLADQTWRGRFYNFCPLDVWFERKQRHALYNKYLSVMKNNYYFWRPQWHLRCRYDWVLEPLQYYLDNNTPVLYCGLEIWVMLQEVK